VPTMYVRVTTTPKSPRKSVKVVEGVREGGKVKQKMLYHVGTASGELEIEKLKQLGREFIAKEQLKRQEQGLQPSLLDEESFEERLTQLSSFFLNTIKIDMAMPEILDV